MRTALTTLEKMELAKKIIALNDSDFMEVIFTAYKIHETPENEREDITPLTAEDINNIQPADISRLLFDILFEIKYHDNTDKFEYLEDPELLSIMRVIWQFTDKFISLSGLEFDIDSDEYICHNVKESEIDFYHHDILSSIDTVNADTEYYSK